MDHLDVPQFLGLLVVILGSRQAVRGGRTMDRPACRSQANLWLA